MSRTLLVYGRRALALGVVVSAGCQPRAGQDQVGLLTGEALGTTWSVKWIGPPQDEDAVRGVIDASLEDVNRTMSTWRPDSDLSRARAADGPVSVDASTGLVVGEALELAALTQGAFEPTVEPLVELWGFHGAPRTTWPTPEELAEARARVGYGRVSVRWDAGGAASLDTGGAALDLSAIAKGYAVDRVSGAVSALGLVRHMVEVGGEVRVQGAGPSGPLWRVGVDQPRVGSLPGQALAGVVALSNAGVATSGNYRNVRVIDGRPLGHTLDPRTGEPAVSDALSATVVAPDCMTADGLATALMVLGSRDGLALIEALPLTEAMVITADEGGGTVSRATSGMPWTPFDRE
ncbi:MAG: FAD:protein FMN transferase [Deltaproteobacteria bacterium]|nr:FAD:protein FMN transferase [Deltaproteobacteria bacterium]